MKDVLKIGCGIALGALIILVASVACLGLLAGGVSKGIDHAVATQTARCVLRERTANAGFNIEPTAAAANIARTCP